MKSPQQNREYLKQKCENWKILLKEKKNLGLAPQKTGYDEKSQWTKSHINKNPIICETFKNIKVTMICGQCQKV